MLGNKMLKFLSGFFIGYCVAKKPPTQTDVEQFLKDIFKTWERLLETKP